MPFPVDVPDDIFFIGGAVNEQTSIFLSDSGEVYSVGNGDQGCLGQGNLDTYFVPERIPPEVFNSSRIVSVQNSVDFAHVLTSDGILFSWGNNQMGQLGFGQEILQSLVPMAHENPEVQQFSVGYRSTVLITKKNEVFQFGQISFIYGVHEMTEPIYYPQKVTGFSDLVILVEAGDSFIIAVTANPMDEKNEKREDMMDEDNMIESLRKEIYKKPERYVYEMWWWGVLGDEFHPPFEISNVPKKLWTHDVRIAQCTAKYSLLCVDINGQVFGMGNNDHNQLLLKDRYYRTIQPIPTWNYEFGKMMNFSRVRVSQFTTIVQEYVRCFDYLDSELDVCSRNGICISTDVCRCNLGWAGSECEYFSCKNVSADDTVHVCRGHGKCIGPEKCDCDVGWSNYDQTRLEVGDISKYGFCKYPKCLFDCNGRGKCVIENNEPKCECISEYRGKICEFLVCNGEDSEDEKNDGCGFSSTCVGPNVCRCRLNHLNWLLPLEDSGENHHGCIASGTKIFVYIVILIVISCCCCCCCAFCLLNVDITSLSCCCIVYNFKRVRFYNGINRLYIFINNNYTKEECIDEGDIPRFFFVTRNYLELLDNFWKKMAFQILAFHEPNKERLLYVMSTDDTDTTNERELREGQEEEEDDDEDYRCSLAREEGFVSPWTDLRGLPQDTRSRIVFCFTGFGDEDGNYFANDRKLLLYEIFEPFSKSLGILMDSGKMANKTVNFLFIFDSICNPRRYKEQFDQFWEEDWKATMLRRSNGMITVEMIVTNGTGQFWRSISGATSTDIRLRKLKPIHMLLPRMKKFISEEETPGEMEHLPMKDKNELSIGHARRSSSLVFGDSDDILNVIGKKEINVDERKDESSKLLIHKKPFSYTEGRSPTDDDHSCVKTRMALYCRAIQCGQPNEGFHF